jgi:hypothetical protein
MLLRSHADSGSSSRAHARDAFSIEPSRPRPGVVIRSLPSRFLPSPCGGDLSHARDILDRLDCRPAFSVVVAALSSVAAEKMSMTLESLANQAYASWQLLVIADQSRAARVRKSASDTGIADRVRFAAPTARRSTLIGPAKGVVKFVGMLAPGDELGADALAEFAVARALHPAAQFFYADEDRISPSHQIREPFFKPDWSPDLLLSTMAILTTRPT